MRGIRRARYQVIIKGLESGNITRLPWLRFATEEEARHWADRLNASKEVFDTPDPLTRFEYEVIDD
jgi:hypothetical protein